MWPRENSQVSHGFPFKKRRGTADDVCGSRGSFAVVVVLLCGSHSIVHFVCKERRRIYLSSENKRNVHN